MDRQASGLVRAIALAQGGRTGRGDGWSGFIDCNRAAHLARLGTVHSR